MIKKLLVNDFILKNEQFAIVSGERLTPELSPIKTAEDNERSDRVAYRFEDGTTLILREKDKPGSDHQPRWLI